MIKKMRWRFIIAAMIAFFLVITLVAVLVNVGNYVAVAKRNDEVLDYIYNYEAYRPIFEQPQNRPPMEPFMALPDTEENYMTRFFIVNIYRDEIMVASDYAISVPGAKMIECTEKALADGTEKGYADEYRYKVVKFLNGSEIIIFLNCSKDIQSMKSLALMSLIVSSGALLLVFILVVILSKRAIQPIAQNIELQKRFITDASHELKTPLTSISTSVDVIEIDRGSDEWTDNIRQQVSRMSGLVSELVTLSRLDEVKPVPEKEHLDLSSTAWETIEVFTSQARAVEKEIKTDIEDNISITGEKASIQQMLSVLIDNAIKYSDDNSEIRFTLKKVHGKARIEVFNTCNYEKAPDADKLFERFYRPDESRNTATGGNGIGLAIAKSVAEAHGGKIKAECPSGRSMTITVEL